MLFIGIFLFSFKSLQAIGDFSSIDFSYNDKLTKTILVETPKNWSRVKKVEKPFNYKFIHESGDCETYIVFSCYQFCPTKDRLFLTVNYMKELYGENYLELAKYSYFDDDYDNIVYFRFLMPKDDKLENASMFSYLSPGCDSCITTVIYIFKDGDNKKLEEYSSSFVESISCLKH
jgi:hypothetical protein